MLSAFVAITPLDPSQPDDAPARLEHIEAIESCHSVAGEESYVLLVRVESARALEDLLQRIRTAANVRTRSTIILQAFYAWTRTTYRNNSWYVVDRTVNNPVTMRHDRCLSLST